MYFCYLVFPKLIPAFCGMLAINERKGDIAGCDDYDDDGDLDDIAYDSDRMVMIKK